MIVFGNGESRSGIEIPIDSIGCNAVFRDHKLKHIVCIDPEMLAECLNSNNTKNSFIYTRPEWVKHIKDERIKPVPALPYKGIDKLDDPWHWSSGGFAVILGSSYSNEINLFGFDLYGNNGSINNIYKGSKNYSGADSQAPNSYGWIYQLSKIFLSYPDKYFVIHNYREWIIPDQWKLDNVIFKIIDKK